MESPQVIFLALIQGITEFLPISSSAHLILPSAVLGWEDQGLAFDVAVHVGSLRRLWSIFTKIFGLWHRIGHCRSCSDHMIQCKVDWRGG